MADFSIRRTMMVDTQVRPSDVTKFPIIDAMLAIPKEEFVSASLREAAYIGENLTLPGGRTILEPRTLSKMLDALDIKPHEVLLDLGCGLGYSTAVAARLADFVVAVESDEDLSKEAQSNLSDHGIDNAAVMTNPLEDGCPASAPYDLVMIHGAVEAVPDTIIDQIKDGGRIAAIFVEGALGVVRIGHKSGSGLTWRYSFNAGAPLLREFTKPAAFAF